jgi:probable HAF family extracellular repeat protein
MRIRSLFVLVGLFAAPAQSETGGVQYQVTDLPSLGGTFSSGNSIDDLGVVAGSSNLSGNQTQHAAVWFFGQTRDLGTLGGPNSGVQWPVKNNGGLIAGIAQTSSPDPLSEPWSCSAFLPSTGPTCLGVVWEWGQIRSLPTLGGNNGFAAGANNLGQVTGWAENTVRDPTCTSGQVLQFRPVVWGPGREEVHELPLEAGDSSGAATGINDLGQAIGISGICDQAVGRFTAIHAVRWQSGQALDLGNLGGVAWNTPMALNERGDVVGFANVPGGSSSGALHEHAFLWTPESGRMTDLGVFPGDVHSQGLGVNAQGQVVGVSCTANFASCRAFIWQNGVMTDLNTLLAPGYASSIAAANDINDWGQIAGQAVTPSGELIPVLLTPEEARSSRAASPGAPRSLSDSARRQLFQRLGPNLQNAD